MIKLKKLLIENSDECEKLFGKYLFGQYRKFYGAVKEKNTEVEQEVFDSLLRWIQSAGRRQVTQQNLDKLLKCKDKYPKILKPTKATYYRAVTLPINNNIVKEIFDMENKTIDKFWKSKNNRKKFVELANFSMDYVPQYKLESWTTSKSSAFTFMSKAKHITTQPVFRNRKGATFIIKADVPENEMLFNIKFTNKLAVDAGWWPQNEVIRISKNKSPIKVMAYYVSILPQVGWLSMYDISKEFKKDIISELKSKWSSF